MGWNKTASNKNQRNGSEYDMNNSLLMAFVYERKTKNGWRWYGALRIGCPFFKEMPHLGGNYSSERAAKSAMAKMFASWDRLLKEYPYQDIEG